MHNYFDNQCLILSCRVLLFFLHLSLFKVKAKKTIKVVILFLCPKVLLETQSGSGLFLDESLLKVQAREPIKIVILFYAQKSSLPTVLYSHWLGWLTVSRRSKNLPRSITQKYRKVAITNTCYYSENQLFVKRSQCIRAENPLHKQSEKAKTCH